MRKRSWGTALAATALILNGCSNGTTGDPALGAADLKIAGSCKNIDTETDAPIVFAYEPATKSVYFGLADSPLKYDVSQVDEKFITAELRDDKALYASYLKSEKIRVDLKTGEISSIRMGSAETADTAKSYSPTAACTWYAETAFEKTLNDSRTAFTKTTPGYLSELAAARKQYEEGGSAESTPAADEDPFPYTAVISCGMNGFDNINVLACLSGDVGTEIEINNGGKYGLYKVYNLPNEWQQTERGVEIPLSRNFSIKMQNSSESLIMGLRVFDNQNNVLFQKQVSRWGVIRVEN